MAGSVNKVILIGNLGKDPKVSNLNSGDRAVSFTLATTENWKDKNTGERRERTEWHNIVIYNEGIGRIVEQYCKKGSKVYLEGQIQNRKYNDQSGAEKYITEIVLQRFRGELTLLDSRGGGEGREGYSGSDERPSGGFARSTPAERRPATVGGGGMGVGSDPDDDIPF